MHNGGEKIYLVNTSNATTATHYALSTELEEEYFADRLYKVIQLAPCYGVV